MKLRQLMYALALTTAFSSTAFADHSETINPDENRTIDKWSFTCTPDKLIHEKDPTIRIHITAVFMGDWVLKDISVQHETYSGRFHDRGEQYRSTGFFGRPSDEKTYLWIWSGIKKDDKKHEMTGGLSIGDKDNKWHYSERHLIHQKGKKDQKTWMYSTCHEASKESKETS